MRRMPVRAVGMAWYYRQDYRRILEIMEDHDVLPATYDQWLKKAERAEGDFKAQGGIVVRAIIDPSEFPAWCATRGLNVDAKARMQFANEAAFREAGKTH